MKPGYKILEHPSDLGIEAWGATLSEAFEQAALGLMGIIVDPGGVRPGEELTISLHTSDTEQLLVQWLSEILYMYDGRQFVPVEFKIRELDGAHLEASVKGETFSPRRHQTRLDVKAVTYHQLLIREEAGISRVRVFLDI